MGDKNNLSNKMEKVHMSSGGVGWSGLMWAAGRVGGKAHPGTDLLGKLQNEKQRTDFQTRFPL